MDTLSSWATSVCERLAETPEHHVLPVSSSLFPSLHVSSDSSHLLFPHELLKVLGSISIIRRARRHRRRRRRRRVRRIDSSSLRYRRRLGCLRGVSGDEGIHFSFELPRVKGRMRERGVREA